MKCRLFVFVAVGLAACATSGIIAKVAQDNYALVQEGHYSGSVRVKNDDSTLQKLVQPWRHEIEANPEFMRGIAEKYFSMPIESRFGYMYTGEDSAARRVLLRYFAYDPHPIVYAGWQIQFVFDRPAKKLVSVYAVEVPLE